MSLNVPVFIKDDTKSSEQTNLSNVPLHGMPLQGTTDNSSNLAWTPFNNTALGGVYPHHSGWDEYEPPEEWPNDIQPDDVQDDDYEPPESFAATDNEIIKISDDDESQGNGDEHISTTEVVPEVRATQREAEPIGTFKHDHADPRERRVVFLQFDHKGVVILCLSNLTMRNTSPTLPSGARGTRGSVNWMHVDYFREIRQIDSTLTKATVERYVFNKLKERGLPQQWLIPSYEILKDQPYLRTMHADRIKRLHTRSFYMPTFLHQTVSPSLFVNRMAKEVDVAHRQLITCIEDMETNPQTSALSAQKAFETLQLLSDSITGSLARQQCAAQDALILAQDAHTGVEEA